MDEGNKYLKTWTDMKYNLKKKAAEIKKEQTKTGGGLGVTKLPKSYSTFPLIPPIDENRNEPSTPKLIDENMCHITREHLKKALESSCSVSGCSESYLLRDDIQRNPNNINTVLSEVLVPHLEQTLGGRLPDLSVFSTKEQNGSSKNDTGKDATNDYPYSPKKRRGKDSVEENPYSETIEIFKKIESTLETNLSEISNSVKKIAENASKKHCQCCFCTKNEK
ncbi:unnamed protein product [Ceutorhynchus assimilis]|uniref:Uncharacterized protein n=1 Tax=Ceutorhynchus assimilis TaxID=467358 RepID=A0A9N9QQD0_9CUCU|nr:unnamed protein product [Ceutorhynchus assimilis]